MLSSDQREKRTEVRGIEAANSYPCIFLMFSTAPYLMNHIIITGQVNGSGSLQGPLNCNNELEIHNKWK